MCLRRTRDHVITVRTHFAQGSVCSVGGRKSSPQLLDLCTARQTMMAWRRQDAHLAAHAFHLLRCCSFSASGLFARRIELEESS
jgi:hypothetical protein